MKKVLTLLGALVLLLLPTHLSRWVDSVRLSPPPALVVHRGAIGRNSNLATALAGKVSAAGVHELVAAARPLYDLARLSVGRPFGLAMGPDGLVAAFTYGIDELRTLRLTRIGDRLQAEVLARAYDVRTETASGEIVSSLFAAVDRAGEQDQLAVDLADIFAWDVDFNTELQKGDSFKVAVEKMYLDGQLVRYGRIVSAELVRGPRTYRAIRYDGVRTSGYFAPDGTPLRKAFLRSPLKFTRISSRFTFARLHPILNERLPHLGVDFAAPVGTPVMAAGDGVVVFAGWEGGFGNCVRLRHANGYTTSYGHLSRTFVRAGQRVEQGSPVGAVGMTGLATGPHLDYRMIRNGVFVDPLRIESPPAAPVPDDERADFGATCEKGLALLAGGAGAASAAAADATEGVSPIAVGGGQSP
jgi:murein DD-endopeptidase MepM/ murein hydrolase activator NlpD